MWYLILAIYVFGIVLCNLHCELKYRSNPERAFRSVIPRDSFYTDKEMYTATCFGYSLLWPLLIVTIPVCLLLVAADFFWKHFTDFVWKHSKHFYEDKKKNEVEL